VVVVRNVNDMTPLRRVKLVEYLKARFSKKKTVEHQEKHIKQNCLIIVSPDLDPHRKFYKNYQDFFKAKRIYDQMQQFSRDLKRVSCGVEFNPLKNEDLLEWVKTQVKRQGKSIDSEAINLLCGALGDNLISLNNEIEKLAIFVAERTTIEPQDVKSVVGEMRVHTVFKLCDAIKASDLKEAMSLLSRLLNTGVDPSYIIGKLREQLVNLFTGRRKWKSYSKVLAKDSVRRDYAQLKAQPKAHLDKKTFEEMLTQLYEAELKMKSGSQKPKAALTLLIYRLCRPQGD